MFVNTTLKMSDKISSHMVPHTEKEATASMVKSIFARMENIHKSNFGMIKETDYNTTQTMNSKRSSSVWGTTYWKKQRAAQGKVLKLDWGKVKV